MDRYSDVLIAALQCSPDVQFSEGQFSAGGDPGRGAEREEGREGEDFTNLCQSY